MLQRLSFILSLTLGLSSVAGAAQAGKADQFEQVGRSKNISQLIRSNSNHYWKNMRRADRQNALYSYLSFEGVLAGDPHLGNFGVTPVIEDNGHLSLKYVDIDFDDAGRGPFVLDFTRLMIATKAVSGSIKAGALTEAYVNGLKGSRWRAPRPIENALAIGIDDYDKRVKRFVSKRTAGERFDYERGDVSPYRGKISRADIEAVFPNFRVLDFARRKKDRGGSAKALRLWVLTQSSSGIRQIFELKQKQMSGLEFYRPQASEADWYQDISSVLRFGIQPTDYQLVNVGAFGSFWRREKKINLVPVDPNGTAAHELEYATELALFDAWYLGTLHGLQSGASAYLASIEQDQTRFKDAVKFVAKGYLAEAIDALRN